MTVQIVKLGRERFVLLREKDYRQLQALARLNGKAKPVRKARRLTAQDRGDIAEAKRRENEPARPYSELRKELGLV
jgi:PHD/YefM family antitoxin component YafN of YafNO toxin-antitoxin module